MAKFFPAILAFALLFPVAAQAQDGQPTMGTSSWQCSFSYIGDLIQEMTDISLPIAQGMVDDGTIVNWGMMTHVFGDEWNVRDEYSSRLKTRHQKSLWALSHGGKCLGVGG